MYLDTANTCSAYGGLGGLRTTNPVMKMYPALNAKRGKALSRDQTPLVASLILVAASSKTGCRQDVAVKKDDDQELLVRWMKKIDEPSKKANFCNSCSVADSLS